METVRVIFEDAGGGKIDCGVKIDDQSSGRTFQKLMVQKAHHKFTLETDIPHHPPFRECMVENTSPDDPETVKFTAD